MKGRDIAPEDEDIAGAALPVGLKEEEDDMWPFWRTRGFGPQPHFC